MNKISIIKFKEIDSEALRAIFSCRINQTSIILRDCRLFEKSDTGTRWVGLPQKTWEQDSEKKYFNLVVFGKTRKWKSVFKNRFWKPLTHTWGPSVETELLRETFILLNDRGEDYGKWVRRAKTEHSD